MNTLEEAIAAYEAGRHHEALGAFQLLADSGDAVAMRYLGRLLANGEGCPQDLSEAAQWYLRAWKANEEPAAHELADILPQLEQKAEDGNALTQFAVGLVWMVVKENPETGAVWLAKAADQDHPEALQLLGDCHRQGKGVPGDETLAYHYYTKAAELGNAKAMYQLGRQFYEGLAGQKHDVEQGLQWYRQAADQGFWPANMALCKLLAARNRDIHDAREAIERLRALSAATGKKCSVSADDGQWSAVASDNGTTLGVSGLDLQELDLDQKEQ